MKWEKVLTAPSPSYRITVRVEYANQVGNLAALAAVIAEAGGSIGAPEDGGV